MAAFSNQVYDGPMSLPDLNVINLQSRKFSTSQPAAKKHGNHRKVTKAAQVFAVSFFQEHFRMIEGQPITNARTQLLHTLDPSNSGGELRTEQSRI